MVRVVRVRRRRRWWQSEWREEVEVRRVAVAGLGLLGLLWTVWAVAVRGADNAVPRRRALAPRAPDAACAAVDVVFTWVNGSAPAHRAQLAQHGYAWDGGYRDYGTLRYALRSVERHMPWARHVVLVTNGETPAWLNASAPRLRLVAHADIFERAADLPTFNSNAIEANLHRIPGLSDCLLYLNDDMFLGADVRRDTFFDARGRPRVDVAPALVAPARAAARVSTWHSSVAHSNALLQQHYYRARDSRGRRAAAVPHRYPSHTCYAMRRDVLRAVQQHWPAESRRTSAHRFRADDDLAVPFLQMNVALEEFGATVAHRPHRLAYGTWSPDARANDATWQRLWAAPRLCMCLNDRLDASPASQREIARLNSLFQQRFPVPSSFELSE